MAIAPKQRNRSLGLTNQLGLICSGLAPPHRETRDFAVVACTAPIPVRTGTQNIGVTPGWDVIEYLKIFFIFLGRVAILGTNKRFLLGRTKELVC